RDPYDVFFFQAEDGIRDRNVTGVQTCALPISVNSKNATSASSLLSLYCSFKYDLIHCFISCSDICSILFSVAFFLTVFTSFFLSSNFSLLTSKTTCVSPSSSSISSSKASVLWLMLLFTFSPVNQ